MAALATALRRDRWGVGTGLMALAAVAWLYMVREAQTMTPAGVCSCLGMSMGGPDHRP